MTQSADAAGIVLVGGRSSRMGRPKALLPFDGRPMVVHVVAMLQELFREVVVVAAPDQELPSMPVTLVRDEVAYQGPLGGIYYGLAASSASAAFVTSCDSAFLNARVISHLVSRIEAHDIVVPYWQERFQPLHAVYRTDLVPLLEAQLAAGALRPVFLFDKVRTLRVEEPEIREIDPEGWTFFNMNTPADYDRALARWNEVRRDRRRCRRDARQVRCTVELYGVARLLARMRELSLALPDGATLSHAYAALAGRLPVLAGRVVAPDGSGLVAGCACNLNGSNFVRDAATVVQAGDHLVIVSTDAGG